MDINYIIYTILLIISDLKTVYSRNRIRGSYWWRLAYDLEIPQAFRHPTNDIASLQTNTITNDVDNMNRSLHPLTKKQRKLVSSNSGSIVAVAQGADMAIKECQYQFANRRWNCPVSETGYGGSVFGSILDVGCRETAFIYAITSASVAHSVARACSEGRINSCSCDNRREIPDGQDWIWGGCSDDVDFGYRFSKQFVDSVERGEDLRYMVNRQNNEAGRRHVKAETSQQCRCHGMSGSCAMKTCWMRLPPFRSVGDLLKERFDGASKVAGNSLLGSNRPTINSNNREGRSSNKISDNKSNRPKDQGSSKRGDSSRKRLNFEPVDASHKTPTRKDIVYFEDSPEFCGKDPNIDFNGTTGRECNETSLGTDGCDLMCCDNGYRTETYTARERCSCTFKWCCEVQCKECLYERVRNTCN